MLTMTQFVLISHASNAQNSLSRTSTVNFQMLKLDLEKAEEPDINLPRSVGSLKKQESSRKSFTYALLTTPKPLTVWITTNWKILQEMEYQTSWEICIHINKPQLELDMQQQSGSE